MCFINRGSHTDCLRALSPPSTGTFAHSPRFRLPSKCLPHHSLLFRAFARDCLWPHRFRARLRTLRERRAARLTTSLLFSGRNGALLAEACAASSIPLPLPSRRRRRPCRVLPSSRAKSCGRKSWPPLSPNKAPHERKTWTIEVVHVLCCCGKFQNNCCG